VFRADDTRGRAARALALARQGGALVRLPPRVARFYLRALRTAHALGDRWSLDVATRPRELAEVLRLARGRGLVVEVGTATAWTALAVALAEPQRRVVSFDVEVRAHRERYVRLVPEAVRARVDLRLGPGERPPADVRDVELLFVDGAHDEASNVAVFEAWRPRLAPGALVLFHDFGDPAYPGVAAAVERLGLQGDARGRLFAWRAS
jgi:predicted O-methyltransferase YrrM